MKTLTTNSLGFLPWNLTMQKTLFPIFIPLICSSLVHLLVCRILLSFSLLTPPSFYTYLCALQCIFHFPFILFFPLLQMKPRKTYILQQEKQKDKKDQEIIYFYLLYHFHILISHLLLCPLSHLHLHLLLNCLLHLFLRFLVFPL